MGNLNQQPDNKPQDNMVYLAINGDGVGGGIGEAIANDDHEALSQISSKLNNAHQGFCQWAEQNGGKVIVSSGDEAIVSIPAKMATQVEVARQQYEADAGHTLTVGIGQSMSEAAKALIYGKMNNKNQTIQYDPHIDDFISESMGGDEENHSVPLDEQGQAPQEGLVPSQIQGNIEGKQSLEQPPQADPASMPDPMAQPPAQAQAPMAPAAQPEGLEQTPAEGLEPSMEGQDPAPEGQEPNMEGQEPQGEVPAIDPDQEQVPEGDSVIPNEGGEEDPNLEQNAEQDPNMEQASEGEELDEQEDPNAQQLKVDIKTALSVFRDNQQLLEQLKGASPEVYNASLAMLRSMIAMAKQLNFAPEGEVSELDEQVDESEDGKQDPSDKENKGFPPKKDGKDSKESEDKGKKEFPKKDGSKESPKEDVKKKPLKTE
jgi:hypothetical protein